MGDCGNAKKSPGDGTKSVFVEIQYFRWVEKIFNIIDTGLKMFEFEWVIFVLLLTTFIIVTYEGKMLNKDQSIKIYVEFLFLLFFPELVAVALCRVMLK